MIIKYNDNELLYLISENDECSYDLLYQKYLPLMKSRIIRFHISKSNQDDFLQECLMMFDRCVHYYHEDSTYSFNKYLDLNIQSCIKRKIKSDSNYFYNVVLADYDFIDTNYDNSYALHEEIIDYQNSDSIEQKISACLQKGLSKREISLLVKINYSRVCQIIRQMKEKVNYTKDENGLSDFERRIYTKYVQGYKPSEISYLLCEEVSTVYNAIKRANRKINNKNQ